MGIIASNGTYTVKTDAVAWSGTNFHYYVYNAAEEKVYDNTIDLSSTGIISTGNMGDYATGYLTDDHLLYFLAVESFGSDETRLDFLKIFGIDIIANTAYYWFQMNAPYDALINIEWADEYFFPPGAPGYYPVMPGITSDSAQNLFFYGDRLAFNAYDKYESEEGDPSARNFVSTHWKIVG